MTIANASVSVFIGVWVYYLFAINRFCCSCRIVCLFYFSKIYIHLMLNQSGNKNFFYFF